MTKKDYIMIARALNAMVWNHQGEGVPQEILKNLTILLSNEFINDNPRFDVEKFKEAVYK